MQIEERAPATLYRLIIAGLAGYGVWLEYSQFGFDMLRLFSGWFLIFACLYYIVSAGVSLFRRSASSRVFCPMLQGALVVVGMILLAGVTIFYAVDMVNPGVSGLAASLVYYILPVLILLDWIIFSEKGYWRAIEPLYWLSLPTIFVCGILVTGAAMSSSAVLRYPYEFLNWPEIGIENMLWQLAVVATFVLIFGYLCWLIDFAMSGKLAQAVVLPHIKTVIIEDGEVVEEDVKGAKKPKVEKVEKVSEDKDEPAEPVKVIEPKIKINIENTRDRKSARNVHKTSDVTEVKPEKSKEPNEKVEKKPGKPKQKEIKIVVKEDAKKPKAMITKAEVRTVEKNIAKNTKGNEKKSKENSGPKKSDSDKPDKKKP